MTCRDWTSVLDALDSLIFGICWGVLCALNDVPIPLALGAGLLAFHLRLIVRGIEDIRETRRRG